MLLTTATQASQSNLRRTNKFIDELHRVHIEFVKPVRVDIDMDDLVRDVVLARNQKLVTHTVEHIRHLDVLQSPKDHVLDCGESVGRDPVVDAQQVGKLAEHFGMHLPVEHVVVDLVEHGRQQVEHVVELGCDELKVQGVEDHGVLTKVVKKNTNPCGSKDVVPHGDRRVHPRGQNCTLFKQERLHCLVIKIISDIIFQFFISYHIKNA